MCFCSLLFEGSIVKDHSENKKLTVLIYFRYVSGTRMGTLMFFPIYCPSQYCKGVVIPCLHLMKLKTRLVKEVPVPAQLSPQTPPKLFWTRVAALAFVLLNLIVRSWCLPHLLYGSTVGHSLLHRTLFRKAFRNLCGGGDAFKSL